MVSLNELPLDEDAIKEEGIEASGVAGAFDVETEQLISEIDLLTSRALQETNQWNTTEARSVRVAVDNVPVNNVNEADNNNSWPPLQNAS